MQEKFKFIQVQPLHITMLTCFRGNFLISAFLLTVIISIVNGSHVAELILDEDLPPAVHGSNDVPTPSSYPSPSDDKFCHVEYQVMKRVIGKCVKLGRSLKGCAAGNYIQPLHPECN